MPLFESPRMAETEAMRIPRRAWRRYRELPTHPDGPLGDEVKVDIIDAGPYPGEEPDLDIYFGLWNALDAAFRSGRSGRWMTRHPRRARTCILDGEWMIDDEWEAVQNAWFRSTRKPLIRRMRRHAKAEDLAGLQAIRDEVGAWVIAYRLLPAFTVPALP